MAKLNNTINTPGLAEGPGRLLKRRLQSGDVLVGEYGRRTSPSITGKTVRAGGVRFYVHRSTSTASLK